MHQSVVVLALLMVAFVAISAEEFTLRRGAKGLLRGEEKSIEHVRERRLKASKSKKKKIGGWYYVNCKSLRDFRVLSIKITKNKRLRDFGWCYVKCKTTSGTLGGQH